MPLDHLTRRILILRGQWVMLSTDLAELYEVEPRAPTQAVRRNIDRFPLDFAFQLGRREFADLRSQVVIAKSTGSNSLAKVRFAPYAFTQEGVAMLSTVLRSERAIQVSIATPCRRSGGADYQVCNRPAKGVLTAEICRERRGAG